MPAEWVNCAVWTVQFSPVATGAIDRLTLRIALCTVSSAPPLSAQTTDPRSAGGSVGTSTGGAPEPGLNLGAALALLEQSGIELPPGCDLAHPEGLQHLIDALCTLSSRDPLSGLPNRRHFDAALAAECDRAARSGEEALLLILDIDHFKKVNDTHGHPVGDAVIRAVAHTLRDSVRPSDTPARIGGEEFAVILPNCRPSDGRVVAERFRERIAGLRIAAAPGLVLQVTVSIGGAFAAPWVRTTPSYWIERADQKLYSAKASGRNRTELESPASSQVSAEEKSWLFATSQFQDLA
jgi:diguanylate cyclase